MIFSLITIPQISYWALAPYIVLLSGTLVVLAVRSLIVRQMPEWFWSLIGVLSGIGLILTEVKNYYDVLKHGSYSAVAHALVVDPFECVLSMMISVGVIAFSLMIAGYSKLSKWEGPELVALSLLSATGAVLLVSAQDLVGVFLGLEIMSIALYVMSGADLSRLKSGEAAVKYLILGGVSSAIFIYGVSLLYGSTGSTNLASIATFLGGNLISRDGIILIAIAMILIGFFFKVSLVPFHVWIPDVYQGAPSPAVTFMASVAKIAGFGALIRIVASGLHAYISEIRPILFVVAILSLLGGALGGLMQRDIKRMLAYSAINHSGFILLGLYALTKSSIAGSVVYLAAYTLFVTGSFSVVSILGAGGDESHDISLYRGLVTKNKFAGYSFTLFLLAQAGVPLTVGFIAKLGVLNGLLTFSDPFKVSLGIIAMASAVISGFFYLRIIINIFGAQDIEPLGVDKESKRELGNVALAVKSKEKLHIELMARTSVGILAVMVVFFGIFPAPIVDLANHAILGF